MTYDLGPKARKLLEDSFNGLLNVSHVEYYQDSTDEWRWRLVAVNGMTLGYSSYGYKDRAACVDSYESFVQQGQD